MSGKNVSYESTTWTETAVGFAAGGKIVEGKARAGTKVDYSGTGKTSFKSKNRAKVKLYVKGKNVMAKARASTHTTVYVGGKAYVVTQEVARAMTRFTPIGTTSAADATMSISAVSSGYLGVSRGATAAATVRVAN